MLHIPIQRYHPFGLAAAECSLTFTGNFDQRRQVSDLISKFTVKGVVMDVVDTVVEVQELSLSELAQVAGGIGDNVLA